MDRMIEKVLSKDFYHVFSKVSMTEEQRFDALYYIVFEVPKEMNPLEELKGLCEDNYPLVDFDETVNGAFCRLSVLLILKDYGLKSKNEELLTWINMIFQGRGKKNDGNRNQ